MSTGWFGLSFCLIRSRSPYACIGYATGDLRHFYLRYEHRRRRREDLLFSFSSGRRPFPNDSGQLGCRPSHNPAWSISPGSKFLEHSKSVLTSFFFLLLLHGLFLFVCFLLSCLCVVFDKCIISFNWLFFLRYMCAHVHNTIMTTHSNKRNTNQPADWKLLAKKNSNKRNSLYKRN